MAADPYVYTMPLVSIDGTDFVCYASAARLTPTDRLADAETFCAVGLEIPSSTEWQVEIDFKLSYAADGSWNLLNAMAKTKKAIILRPDTAVIGVTNPQADFEMYVPSVPFMDAAIGETGEFTMSATTVGEPLFTTA